MRNMLGVESQGAVDIVSPEGPMNLENTHEFTNTIQEGLPGGQPMVVVDFSEVALLDSAGLEALVDAHEFVHQQGGSIKFACVNALCREVLRITQVEQNFEVYPDVKAAVGSFLR